MRRFDDAHSRMLVSTSYWTRTVFGRRAMQFLNIPSDACCNPVTCFTALYAVYLRLRSQNDFDVRY